MNFTGLGSDGQTCNSRKRRSDPILPHSGATLTFCRRLLYRVAKDDHLDDTISHAHTVPGLRRWRAVAAAIGDTGPDHKSAASPWRG